MGRVSVKPSGQYWHMELIYWVFTSWGAMWPFGSTSSECKSWALPSLGSTSFMTWVTHPFHLQHSLDPTSSGPGMSTHYGSAGPSAIVLCHSAVPHARLHIKPSFVSSGNVFAFWTSDAIIVVWTNQWPHSLLMFTQVSISFTKYQALCYILVGKMKKESRYRDCSLRQSTLR